MADAPAGSAAPADPLVDLLVEDPGWEAWPLAEVAERAARAALAARGLEPGGYTVSLLACSDARIAALNAEWRGRAAPTNVLSWPAFDLAPAEPGGLPEAPPAPRGGPVLLGDIALARETLLGEAAAAGLPPMDHALHLLLHATLHLLGFDHEDEADARRMEALESETLVRMGVPDPYSDADSREESQPQART